MEYNENKQITENESIKFSVVLPIYNVEKYLKRCMDSVLNQTYKNLEIIMVDDESPDACPQMCDEYAKTDNRVKVVHKQNEGLGFARNTGIENATGDYICFFDSDDFVAENLFEICANELASKKYDVVCFDCSVFKDGKIIEHSLYPEKREFFGKDVQNAFLKSITYNRENNERLQGSAWNKIYSMKLIKETNFRFVSEREYISEDHYSNLILYKNVNSVLAIPGVYYFYCYNETSLTHSLKKDRFKKNIYQYEQGLKLCNENGYSEEIKLAVAFQTLGNILGAFKLLLLTDQMTVAEKKNEIYNVVHCKQYQELFKALNMTNERFSRKLFVWAFKHKFCGLLYLLLKYKYSK